MDVAIYDVTGYDVIATDDLGRPIYGLRKAVQDRPGLSGAWNCGVGSPPENEIEPASGLRRCNPGLAFAEPEGA